MVTALTACDAGTGTSTEHSWGSDFPGSAEGAIVSSLDYPQAFGNAQHTGIAAPELTDMTVVAAIVQDENADATNDEVGFLMIHESPPVRAGDFVVVPSRRGNETVFDRSTDEYSVQTLRWIPSVMAPGAMLKPVWSARTDWQPVDGAVGSIGYVTNGYVQQFAPAIRGGSLYMPARSGKLIRLSLATGAVQAVINPFAGTMFNGDGRVVVNSALSVSEATGNVYYTVVAWPVGTAGPALRGIQARGTWIVEVHPDNTFRRVDFDALALAAGLPDTFDLCEWPFRTAGTLPATGPDSRAPLFGCGRQRPAVNSPVAINKSGTRAVVWSYANNAQGAAFLTEIDLPSMAPIRTMDTRGHLLHGCGVRLSIAFPGCNVITANGTVNIGNDPNFNGPVRFRGEDLLDSAPVISPNGQMLIGNYDGGEAFGAPGSYDARGAGLIFSANGILVAKNEDFWWEVTPSVWQHGAELSYLQDRQLFNALDLGVAQYDPAENLEELHTVDIDFDAVAIDFLDAHVQFGPGGDRYAVNGDGHVYKFRAGVKGPVDSVALTNPDGSVRSMETLSNYSARDQLGRLYISYAGVVYVIASGSVSTAARRATPLSVEARARLERGRIAKFAAVANTAIPEPPK